MATLWPQHSQVCLSDGVLHCCCCICRCSCYHCRRKGRKDEVASVAETTMIVGNVIIISIVNVVVIVAVCIITVVVLWPELEHQYDGCW